MQVHPLKGDSLVMLVHVTKSQVHQILANGKLSWYSKFKETCFFSLYESFYNRINKIEEILFPQN